MSDKCSFCHDEYPDNHNWIDVGHIKIITRILKKSRVAESTGPHRFCCISCLNTYICTIGDDEYDQIQMS